MNEVTCLPRRCSTIGLCTETNDRVTSYEAAKQQAVGKDKQTTNPESARLGMKRTLPVNAIHDWAMC